MDITYKVNESISVELFSKLLIKSTLSERRPINDKACLSGMLEHSNLLITAWHNDKLIGIARSITDFHYACYLSDLAVDKAYQGLNVGKKLQDLTQTQLNEHCKLILISAPSANDYYDRVGFTNNSRCWVLNRENKIKF